MKLAAKLAAAVSVALALTTAPVAMADSRYDRDERRTQSGRDDRGRDWRHDRHDHERHDHDRRDHDRHDHDRRDRDWRDHERRGRDWRDERYRDHRYRDHRYYDPRRHDRWHRHPGPYHRPYGYAPYRWHRGARLPAAYCAPRYVIHDHHAYRLRPPPRGHHWLRVDGDAILAAIATGIVLEVVSNYYG